MGSAHDSDTFVPNLLDAYNIAPSHQQNDLHMFEFGTLISHAPKFPFVTLNIPFIVEWFGLSNPNPPLPLGAQEAHKLDIEGWQGPHDTTIPNPTVDPMHDVHVEVGFR